MARALLCEDLDLLEEMIHGDDGIKQHEQTLRKLQHILHIIASRLGLEVFDTCG